VDRLIEFVADPAAAHPVTATAIGRRPRAVGTLSPREIEVLRLLANGETNGQIAASLEISINTVERHVSNLYRKIDARGRADATAWAIRNGIA
jgi:DNA-binding NarL/FixJ family response regulator